ncbi:unnamed protein product [Caenorhabditis nigoni]
MSEALFASVTHGTTNDCRLANARLKETLRNYNFRAFLMERTLSKCPNDDCNLAFIFILEPREYERLQLQVHFETRPTILVHHSFAELLEADRKIRRLLLEDNSVGCQVGPEMATKMVDACPPVHNIPCQTDFMVGKKDTGGQTDDIYRNDAECQATPEMPQLEISEVIQSNSVPAVVDNVALTVLARPTSPLVTMEVQEDDDVVFIETRMRVPHVEPIAIVKAEEPEPEPVEEEENPLNLNITPELEVKAEPVEEVHTALEKSDSEEEPVKLVPAPDTPIVNEQVSLTTPQRMFSTSSFTSVISSGSDSFHTPPTANTSVTSMGSAAKRPKYSDIEMCQRCLDVTYYTHFSEYVNHILESHVSIYRFKCTLCQRKFSTSQGADRHLMSHVDEGLGNAPMMVVPEVSDDHLRKFIIAANECYPERFRNIPHQEIAESIEKLP